MKIINTGRRTNTASGFFSRRVTQKKSVEKPIVVKSERKPLKKKTTPETKVWWKKKIIENIFVIIPSTTCYTREGITESRRSVETTERLQRLYYYACDVIRCDNIIITICFHTQTHTRRRRGSVLRCSGGRRRASSTHLNRLWPERGPAVRRRVWSGGREKLVVDPRGGVWPDGPAAIGRRAWPGWK